MIQADSRKLKGLRFGFSISAPPDDDENWPSYYGDPVSVVNQFVYDEASHILFEGGGIVLGHRWNTSDGRWNRHGILNHLVRKSREYRRLRPVTPDPETGKIWPSILNLLAWPDEPPPESEKNSHRFIEEGVLAIQQILPESIDPELLDTVNSPRTPESERLGTYFRIRALTAMRNELARLADFRICLGGTSGKNTRRLPGVIEEAIATIRAQKPLFVSSAFGGASKALADCLLQRDLSSRDEALFFTPDTALALMQEFDGEYPPGDATEGASTHDGWNAIEWFRKQPFDELAERVGLGTDEFINLLTTPKIDRAMGWLSTGVNNLRQASS